MKEEIYCKDFDAGYFLITGRLADQSRFIQIVQGIDHTKSVGPGSFVSSRSGSYISIEALRKDCMLTNKPCIECGCLVETRYNCGEEMRRQNICFFCLHWQQLAAKVNDPKSVRVNNNHYQIGNGTGPSPWRGFGGQTFKIQFFDGRQETTTDLWHQGTIPPIWRDRLPNNAEFVAAFKPSNKSTHLEQTLTKMFGHDRRDSIYQNKCAPKPIGCGKSIDSFRDALSEKEFTISGLCQQCQDNFFGK